MTETFEPFQVVVKAQPRPLAYATLPTSPQPTPPSVMWYNVKTMYGADNSGNIDSTVVIQNAIDAAHAAGGGVVYFPPGTYRISAALIVYGGSQLRGDGDANTIIRQVTPNVGCITGTDLYQFKLSNIQLLGTGAGTGKGIFFKLSSFSNTGFLHFEDVFVQKFGGDGIDIDTPISSVFDRVITQTNGGNGWNTHSNTFSTSCTWNACFSKSNGATGFAHTNLSYSSMNGCSSTGNRTAYILTNCQSVVMDSPGADSNVGDNFVISGGIGNVLIAPRVFQNNGYGIHLTANAKNCVIVGAYDNAPLAGVTNFIATDAGTSCTVINVNNTTANLYNGSVNVLDDGSGNVTTPGLLTARGVDTTALSTASVSKTGAYTLTLNDNVVLCNATSGAFTVTLPNSTAASVVGTIFLIKKTDASINAVTLAAAGGQTIDGRATATLTSQYAFVAVQSDGSNWQIVGGASSNAASVTGVAWYNVKSFGADSSGTNDSTASIQAAINAAGAAGGGVVYLPAGNYKVVSQLNVTNLNSVTVFGDGQATYLKPTSSFTGGASVIAFQGGNANRIENIIIQWPSSTASSNPGANAIYVAHSTNFHLSNVEVLYNNGWTMLIYSDATGDSYYPVIEKFHTYYCVGGMACIGTNSPDHMMGLYLANSQFDNCQSYPAIQLQDIWDAQITNIDGSSNLSNFINITGTGGAVTINNVDMGCSATGTSALLIGGSASAYPYNVMVSDSIIQGGNYACYINYGKQISFTNCTFQQARGHGLFTANTANIDQVSVTGCVFTQNGLVATNSYDLAWNSPTNIVISNCIFNDVIGSAAGQVLAALWFLNGSTSAVNGCYFSGGQGNGVGSASPVRNTRGQGNIGDYLVNVDATARWFDVRKYGADPTNNLDSTAAIQAAINAAGAQYAGGVVYIPAGGYKISAPLTLNGLNYVTILGDDQSTRFFIPATFVGAAIFIITAGTRNSITNIQINGAGGYNVANNVWDGIQTLHADCLRIENVEVVGNSGWGVNITNDTNAGAAWHTVRRLRTWYNKGGLNIQGTVGQNTAIVMNVSDCEFNNPQASPGINIQDAQFINVENCIVWGNQGNGLAISGASSMVTVNNCLIGPYGSANYSALFIATTAGNSPAEIYISNCAFQAGAYSQVFGTKIFFVNCEFSWAQSHGLYFGSPADQISIAGCTFFLNGRTAGSGHYDLCCNTAGYYNISGCHFMTGIGVGGTQVQNSILTSANSTISGCRFIGAQGTAVNTYPQFFFGNIGDTTSNFNGNVTASAALTGQTVKAGGLAGTTAATRYVGASGGNGPPGAGTFAVGDMVVDPQGQIYICTVAGSPGTWTSVGSFTAFATANPNYTVPNDGAWHNVVGAVVTINVQPGQEVLVNYSSYGLVAEGNTAAHAILSCNLFLDGSFATGVASGFLCARNASTGYGAMIPNIWKFTGLSSGNHIFQLVCAWNGTASQATIQQSQISATASRPPM